MGDDYTEAWGRAAVILKRIRLTPEELAEAQAWATLALAAATREASQT